ncbi:FAD/NAD(P)-binding domain-containing protein, partial [Lentinula aff. detonsa]
EASSCLNFCSGGGIGGLTCAVALKDCPNIDLDLYEQAAQITEIGAGITVWPRTWVFLKSMGLEKDLLAILPEGYSDEPKLAFEFRISDRKDGFTFHKIYAKGGALCFHRQEIQRTLLKHIPKSYRIHLSHRMTRCEESGDCVKMFFKSGLEATCDVLIGADGIKSVTRGLFPNEGIFYTGSQVYRGLIPKESFAKSYPNHKALEGPIQYCGKNKHIVVYPISGGRIINVVAFFSNPDDEGKSLDGPEIRSATTEEALKMFSGWEDEVGQLLGSIEAPSRWVIRDLRPMETYVSRRIALVGDSCHTMTPHLGAGAGQAMEDGYVLGRLFSRESSQKWERILQAYNQVRHPFGNMVQRNAREQGFFYELNAPGFENITTMGQELSPEQVSLLRATITRNWSWWEDDADEDLARAIGFLS